MAYQLGPDLDFSALARLPQVDQQARNEQNVRDTLATLGQGGDIDPMRLIQSGDQRLATLGFNLIQRREDQARQAQQDARQIERDRVADARADRQFTLQQSEAARAQRNADRQFAYTQEQAKERPTLQKLKDESGNEILVRVMPDGSYTQLRAGAGPEGQPSGNPFGPGKFNETQGKAAGFSDRMLQSESLLSGTEPNKGLDAQGLDTRMYAIDNAPKVPDLIKNKLFTEDYQKYSQAKRDFINAQLRRESGAVISPEEFNSANKQYFPMPGDTPDVLSQKRANRRAAIEAMGREGGQAYRPKFTYGEDGTLKPYGKGAAAKPQSGGGDALGRARDAIAKGADRNAVIQRLQENGIDPSGL